RYPQLATRSWFRWASGSLPLPMSDSGYRNLGLAILAAVIAFDLGTYDYYRGSILSHYHSGPVSPTTHHDTLSNGMLLPSGGVRFHAYLDGGSPAVPSHIMEAELLGSDKAVLMRWDAETLSHLPSADIENDFAYNKIEPARYGLAATVGAAATI